MTAFEKVNMYSVTLPEFMMFAVKMNSGMATRLLAEESRLIAMVST